MITKMRNTIAAAVILLMGSMVLPAEAQQTGTLTPTPYQTVLNSSGAPVSGGCIWTYVAGTSTQAATYTAKAVTIQNANPIVADSAGQFVAYLLPGQSYKFVYETACIAPAHGAVLRTQDGIDAVPAVAVNLDVTGTAGEALTAGQAVYLSAGDGAKAAGQWFKADSANAYSSSAAVSVGMVPTSIVSAAAGTIRLAGQMTGLSSLTLGGAYYIGSAGAITLTAPANARKLGEADTTTTLVMPLPGVPTQAWVDDFRLTVSSGNPVPTADVTGASAVTVYLSPYVGNRIDLPDALGNPQRTTTAEISVAVPASTNTMYDVFAFLNGGTPTIEVLAWTNDSTRATAVVRTNGRYFKTGDLTRLYVGSFRTTGTIGQTEDSVAKRHVWNYYNRVRRPMRVLESTATWPYTLTAFRQANAAPANQLAIVVGIAEVTFEPVVMASFINSTGAATAAVGIGLDGVAAVVTGSLSAPQSSNSTGQILTCSSTVRHQPAAGYHFYVWMESSTVAGTTNWQGVSAAPFIQSGITGTFEG